MAYTTLDKPSAHCSQETYAGSNSTTTISGMGFKPDLIITKNRPDSSNWNTVDSSRGNTKNIYTNEVSGGSPVEDTNTRIASFTSDGYTLTGGDALTNTASKQFRSWNWKANGGSRTTFTESGNNPGGGRQVNVAGGFAIIDYVGTGAVGTIAHGLGAAPAYISIKNRSVADHWSLFHGKQDAIGITDPQTDFYGWSDASGTQDSAAFWNDTAPTSSVFTVGTDHRCNADGENYVAYVWTPIQGYSDIGSYTGNGSANGSFIYTGFRPAMTIVKKQNGNEQWLIQDAGSTIITKAGAVGIGGNPTAQRLSLKDPVAEDDNNSPVDYYSNGFKWKAGNARENGAGVPFIYIAFAEMPLVGTNGVIALAR